MQFTVGKAKYVPGTYPKQAAGVSLLADQNYQDWLQKKKKAPAAPKAVTWPVICFSRQIGVGALEVADRLAPMIGYTVFDRALIEKIAVHRELRQKTVSLFDERYPGRITEFAVFLAGEKSFIKSDYARSLSELVYSLAGFGGALFVGRGIHRILPRDRVLAVRFIADRKHRIKRLRHILKVTARDADKLIDQLDAEQKRYFKKIFGRTQVLPEEFDLVINLDFISDPQSAADIVALAFEQRKRQLAGKEAKAA
jgi:hypothetical protein